MRCLSDHWLCHSSRSAEKSIAIALQLPFSQRVYRSSYEIRSIILNAVATPSSSVARCPPGRVLLKVTRASGELRRLPRRVQAPGQLVREVVDRDPRLVERVAVA